MEVRQKDEKESCKRKERGSKLQTKKLPVGEKNR